MIFHLGLVKLNPIVLSIAAMGPNSEHKVSDRLLSSLSPILAYPILF